MEGEMLGTLLLYGGIAIMVFAVLAAVLASVLFGLSGRRLRETLQQEYGRKQ